MEIRPAAVPVPLPKLSYVLLAYNREQYIREAVESAFAQEYEGELEYIFSDDCSTDNTYAIMQECVAAYTGSRRVVLTQTPQNGHLAAHTNHAVGFVESDWVVRADDDDYSRVDRCAIIGRAIAENPGCRYVVTGVCHFTDEDAHDARHASQSPCGDAPIFRVSSIDNERSSQPHFSPATYSYKAWHMEIFRRFGPLMHDAYYVDDLTCYHRANLLGSAVFVENAPAVYAREGCANMSRGGNASSRGYDSTIHREQFNDKYFNVTYEPLVHEWTVLRNEALHLTDRHRPESVSAYLAGLEQDIAQRALWKQYWRKGSLNRLATVLKLKQKLTPFTLIRCLPLPVFAAVLAFVRWLK